MTVETFNKKNRGIMISEFLLFFKCLTLLHLFEDNNNVLLYITCLTKTEADEIVKYAKKYKSH